MITTMKWRPPSQAPKEAWPCVVSVRITCKCGEGGIVVLTAARVNGEWIIGDFEHSFDIIGFMILPVPPETLAS